MVPPASFQLQAVWGPVPRVSTSIMRSTRRFVGSLARSKVVWRLPCQVASKKESRSQGKVGGRPDRLLNVHTNQYFTTTSTRIDPRSWLDRSGADGTVSPQLQGRRCYRGVVVPTHRIPGREPRSYLHRCSSKAGPELQNLAPRATSRHIEWRAADRTAPCIFKSWRARKPSGTATKIAPRGLPAYIQGDLE